MDHGHENVVILKRQSCYEHFRLGAIQQNKIMSVESDEVQLKDLLVQILTANGSLPKIKAQLRASVFQAMEDSKSNNNKPLLNTKVKTCLETQEGKLMFSIVREFLGFFDLKSTISVFEAESYLGTSYEYLGRPKITDELGFIDENTDSPLLKQLLMLAQQQSKSVEVILNLDNNTEYSENSIKTDSDLSSSMDNSSNDGVVATNKINGSNSIPPMNQTYLKEYYKNDETENSDLVNEAVSIGKQVNSPISEQTESITPLLKDTKSPERVKSPSKSKNNLNSLSDLPPLNMNKTKTGTILPSLYNKEFKEKPS